MVGQANPKAPGEDRPLLQVNNLRTYFFVRKGVVRAVDGVSFDVGGGEVLGIVGESGCGKSVTGLSIMNLISPPGRIVSGEVLLRDEDVLKVPKSQMHTVRGNKIAMVFQDPMTSLNPVLTVGRQISETILTHQKVGKRAALEQTIEMLRLVGIPLPDKRMDDYPHHLSGGQRQRVGIAIALSCQPSVLIADEPTTALDVTIQAQILELILEMNQLKGASVILISHDLGVIAETARRVVVMYAGKVVEFGSVYTLLQSPLHPYTQGLLRSIPYLRRGDGQRQKTSLPEIPGSVPNLLNLPPGCSYHPRCPLRTEQCVKEEPPTREIEEGHLVRCVNC